MAVQIEGMWSGIARDDGKSLSKPPDVAVGSRPGATRHLDSRDPWLEARPEIVELLAVSISTRPGCRAVGGDHVDDGGLFRLRLWCGRDVLVGDVAVGRKPILDVVGHHHERSGDGLLPDTASEGGKNP